MKKLLSILIVLGIFVLTGQSQTMLWHYGFETPGGYTTAHPEHNDHSYDYFARVTNDSISPNYDNPDGIFFFAAQDIDADGGVNPDTLFISGIDISGATQTYLTFQVFLSEVSAGWDPTDFTHFYYRVDGGAYQNLLWFENDGSAYNSRAFQDTDFDGTGDGDSLEAYFKPFSVQIPSGGTTLDLMIVFSLNSSYEDIAVDSLTIWDGDAPAANPQLVNAYAISNNILALLYDSDMSSVNPADYELTDANGNTITFTNAVIDANNAKLVYLTSASDFPIDAVVDTIKDNANSASFVLYAGILPLSFTNTASSNLIQNDINATFFGIVSATDAYNQTWVQTDNGAYNGVMIYNNNLADTATVGSQYLFVAQRAIYNGLTELKNPIILNYLGNATPSPAVINSSDIKQGTPQDDPTAEQWEGQLVTIENVTAIDQNTTYYEYYVKNANGDTIIIDDDAWYQYGNTSPITIGNTYNITGVVTYAYGNYKLNPRNADDIVEVPNAGNDTLKIEAAFTYSAETIIGVAYESKFDTIDVNSFVLREQNTGAEYTPVQVFPFSDSTGALLLFNTPITFNLDLDTLYDMLNHSSAVFYAGFAPISYFNTNNSNGTILNEVIVTTRGVVTANDNYNQVWIQDNAGETNGLLVFEGQSNICDAVNVGDSLLIIGIRSEYNGMTELIPGYFETISNDNQVLVTDVNLADLDTSIAENTNPAELYEGQLVRVQNVTVVDYNSSTYEFTVTDANGNVGIIDDDVDYHWNNSPYLEVGKTYNITGVVTYSYGHYKINPRDTNDVEEITMPATADATIIAPEEQIAGDTLFIDENYNFQNSVAVIKFGIVDLGQDGLPTKVTQAVAVAGPENTADFDADLDGGVLIDENNNAIPYTTEPHITADSAILPVDPTAMTIDDGDTVFYTAYLWLDTATVTEGHILQMKVGKQHFFVADPSGSQFVDTLENDILGNTFIITVHNNGGGTKVFENSAEIYPNPAINYIKFNGVQINTAEIYTTNGQLIRHTQISNNTLNIEDLQKGAYIVKLYDENGNIYVHKLIKQ